MNHLNKIVILIAALLLPLFFYNVIEAKRMAPKEVEPVIYNGVKYIAPHEKMGYVEAWDVNTGNKLWEKKVYSIIISPFLETDVQWVFITDLSIENERLIVVNEDGNKYEIDIRSGDIVSKDSPRIIVRAYWDFIIAAVIILALILIISFGGYLLYRYIKKNK